MMMMMMAFEMELFAANKDMRLHSYSHLLVSRTGRN